MIIYICLMAVMAYLAFRWGKETKAGTCHMMKEYTEKKEMAQQVEICCNLWENVPVPAVDSWQSAFSGECWQEIFRECWQRFPFYFTVLVLSVPC